MELHVKMREKCHVNMLAKGVTWMRSPLNGSSSCASRAAHCAAAGGAPIMPGDARLYTYIRLHTNAGNGHALPREGYAMIRIAKREREDLVFEQLFGSIGRLIIISCYWLFEQLLTPIVLYVYESRPINVCFFSLYYIILFYE